MSLINNVLSEFSKRLKGATHIRPLMKHELFSVTFCTDHEQISLVITNGDSWTEENCKQTSLMIKGEDQAIIKLIEGTTRLQQLQKRGEVHIDGKYKHVLRLESLLYCCSKIA